MLLMQPSSELHVQGGTPSERQLVWFQCTASARALTSLQRAQAGERNGLHGPGPQQLLAVLEALCEMADPDGCGLRPGQLKRCVSS